MVKTEEPKIEEITMTETDMKNICLILLENTAAALFMHHYEEEPLDVYDCREMAVKIKGVVENLREVIF